MTLKHFCLIACLTTSAPNAALFAQNHVDQTTLRVFIFAGQSNMVGSDSRVDDIKRFPPFVDLEYPQPEVRFSYIIGREHKTTSDGWVTLRPVNELVGPELSFARHVSRAIPAPLAIIKCAAGGTHLGGDWNPDQPAGFEMYPLMLNLIKSSLGQLDQQGIQYRLEGFMWHQGENDMFEEAYLANYGSNLSNFIAKVRRDLDAPTLKFYIGELCTKTIWGMDLRPRMYAISRGQRAVTETDPLAEYIPTAHIAVEIGGGVGLHYHYGTLGQLEHGVNYADAYLRTIGKSRVASRPLKPWPYKKDSRVRLFVLAGHRNMEGERAFVQELESQQEQPFLFHDNPTIAFKYSLGGGYRISQSWEPLGPVGFHDTFGPELSFARELQSRTADNIAIAKFTHSGSQIIDWTPEGSMAETRHLYPAFIAFVKEAINELQAQGHPVELAGIFYHLGENDMSFSPYRNQAAAWLQALIRQSRKDLAMPSLRWFVSQQSPTDDPSVNEIDITAQVEAIAAADHFLVHIKALNLPIQEQKLVIPTAGIVELGELLADRYLSTPAAPGAGLQSPEFSFGLLADIQYGDKETAGHRRYRESLPKLSQCITQLNLQQLAFIANLGDIIDGRGEHSSSDLERVLDIMHQAKTPVHHVVGNHCLEVSRAVLLPSLGLQKGHYSFRMNDWLFVVLDTMDVSVKATVGSEQRTQAEAFLASRPELPTYNGAVGEAQLAWLAEELANARRNNLKVVIFSHHPIATLPDRSLLLLWNAEEVRTLLTQAGCVVACFAGHDHAGAYALVNGIHYLTLPGMVEAPSESNCYAVVSVYGDRLELRGYGEVPTRTLHLDIR